MRYVMFDNQAYKVVETASIGFGEIITQLTLENGVKISDDFCKYISEDEYINKKQAK